MGCTTNNKVQLDSLKECWKKESIANPNIVAKHKWAAFLCLQTQSSLTTFPYIQANKYGFSLSNDNVLRDYYVKIIDAEFSKKFYKAWFYLLACAVFFLFSCFLFRYSKRNGVLLSIFISLSGLLYSLSYLALSPCNDLRYNYWTIGATLLSGIIFIDELSIKIKN
jgi:hypothetical protein